MKKNIYIKMVMLQSVIIFFFSMSLQGRVSEVNSRNRLFSRINQASMVVAQFYFCERGACHEKCQKEDYRDIKSSLRAVSQNNRFIQAEIDFVLMNGCCDPCVAQEFSFSRYPTLMLFVNGMPIPGARLTGFVHECDINSFIERYLGNDIDDIIAEKKEDRQQEQAVQLAAWSAWGPYWYGGYYRPCGWGFYGGCGWGRYGW